MPPCFFVRDIIFSKAKRWERVLLKSEWEVSESHREWEELFHSKFNISYLLAHLLANRGVQRIEDAEQFLFPERIEGADPYLMADMEKAIDELIRIRETKKPLMIYGDYDVDGVTGTALYYLVLEKWGWKVEYHIPSRLDEGYGLSKDAILKLHEDGFDNIITVDCGITSVEEIGYANSIGCNVIVTDHHEPKEEMPPAAAIVDPKRPGDPYPFKGFSGVGVAYKVLQALKNRLKSEEDLEEYLDIVALGTVADIVPILGENRYFVYKGLQMLSLGKRVGISKLIELSNVRAENLKTHDVGFRIAPKINAVGRIDSAYTALRLILENDPKDAETLAEELLKKNQERQFIENLIYQQAMAQLDVMKDVEKKKIFVLYGKNWHPGVIGIVASKILSNYHRPTLMISVDGEIARGSARSVDGVNIVEVLGEARDILDEFGGHKMAAGFSLQADRIKFLEERLNGVMERYDSRVLHSKISVDARIKLSDVDEAFISDLERLRPYGNGNTEPTFLVEDLVIDKVKSVGQNGNHLRIFFREGTKRFEAIGFGLSELFRDLNLIGGGMKKADVVVNVWKNNWNGVERYQLNIIDMDVKNETVDQTSNFKGYDSRKIKFSKIVEEKIPTLVIGTPYMEEQLIMDMASLTSNRLVIVAPINSILVDLYNSLRFELKNAGHSIGYVDAMHRNEDRADVIFTNIVSLRRVLKGGEDLIVCEPQLMIRQKVLGRPTALLANKLSGHLVFFSSFLHRGEEKEVMNAFSIDRLHNEFHKRDVGVIDDRNVIDKIGIIEDLLSMRSGRTVAFFSDQRLLREVLSKLCQLHPQMCESSQILSYAPNGNYYAKNHISGIVKRKKVRLFLTTTAYTGKLEGLNRIVYYDFPRNHIELLKPPSLLSKNITVTPLIQMLFGTTDVNKNLKDLEQIFPAPDKVVEAAELLINGSGDPATLLVDSKVSESKGISQIYLSIFEEMKIFDGQRVTRIPEREEIMMASREREGLVEMNLLKLLKDELMDQKTRSIARIFHNPFEAHEESVR